MNEMLDSFNNYICSCCKKEKCERGIVIFPNGAKCVDYEKDETKIQKAEKPLIKTAKKWYAY